MPVPTQLSDLNATAASNSPAATDTISTTDDYLRAHASILARISAGTDALTSPDINGGSIDGTTIGGTTPAAGAFTTLSVTSTVTMGDGTQFSSANQLGWRNRLINGDMRIDQRNAGASVSNSASRVYTVDRWASLGSAGSKFTIQQSTTAPAGFKNSLLITSSAATSVAAGDYYLIQQRIEGSNVADLGWGTADAQPVTLSFRVRSSLTGTFGGALRNSASDRSYPFSYTISSANTWETKTVNIAGDTTGTWLTDTGIGIDVNFGLGIGSTFLGTAGSWAGANYMAPTGATSVVGTNGATFYITGVQLEKGSVSTPYEYIDFSEQLRRCQRYYFKTYAQDVVPGTATSAVLAPIRYIDGTHNYASIQIFFPVTMRAAPTVTVYNPVTGATGSLRGDGANHSAVVLGAGVQQASVNANNVSIAVSTGISAHITAAIEL